jgi:hypothetical protein
MNNLQNELLEAKNVRQFTKIAELLEETNNNLNQLYSESDTAWRNNQIDQNRLYSMDAVAHVEELKQDYDYRTTFVTRL